MPPRDSQDAILRRTLAHIFPTWMRPSIELLTHILLHTKRGVKRNLTNRYWTLLSHCGCNMAILSMVYEMLSGAVGSPRTPSSNSTPSANGLFYETRGRPEN